MVGEGSGKSECEDEREVDYFQGGKRFINRASLYKYADE